MSLQFFEGQSNQGVNQLVINRIQDEGGGGGGGEKKKQKGPPTSFSPVTSTNVGIGSQNFLTFSFDPFPTLL